MIHFPPMAWRIDEQVIRGEIDNRTRGQVRGRLWLVGRERPLLLELDGNPWRDLAGHILRFSNPQPKPGNLSGLTEMQVGAAGDITASRKVKVPDCSMDELMEFFAARKPFPWHWGNSIYLEWFSKTNGRVVIESATYQLELDPLAAWSMSEAEEAGQRQANAGAMTDFMGQLGTALAESEAVEDEDAPRSTAEKQADDEDARMNLLLDRVTARLEREGHEEGEFERIYQEERDRLRRERGESEQTPTPEQQAEREAWINEMNAAAAEAMADLETEKWKDEDSSDQGHPLVARCSDLAVKLHHELDAHTWIPADALGEHPLHEVVSRVMSASAKLAGALGISDRDEEWPPPAFNAGNVLVRLKKARGYLRDALRGLDSADEENLATAGWRDRTRREVESILSAVQVLIRVVRAVLADEETDDG